MNLVELGKLTDVQVREYIESILWPEGPNTEFKIRFSGHLHEIDADTLVSSIMHVSAVLHEINSKTGVSGKLQVRVKALAQGSFLVHLELLSQSSIESIKNIFNSENIQNAANVLTIFGTILEIHKHLSGRSPKSDKVVDEDVTIVNQAGGEIIVEHKVYKIYKEGYAIRVALEKNFGALANDDSISDYEILDSKDNVIVHIDQSEFAALGNSNEIMSENEEIVRRRDRFVISRINFDNSNRWGFICQGNKISARVIDQRFINNINQGQPFSKGDTLDAIIEYRRRRDEISGRWEESSHAIVEVYEHIRNNTQEEMEM